MVDYIEGRAVILQALKAELMGPSPQGKEIDCSQPISFDDAKQSYGPWRQQGSGEEILMRDSPCKRYGVGVLYPIGTPAESKPQEPLQNDHDNPIIENIITDNAQKLIDNIEKKLENTTNDPESYDFDLSEANAFKPSSMGISFLAEIPENARLVVEVSGGRYKELPLFIKGQRHTWWLRSPISMRTEYDANALCTPHEAKASPRLIEPQKLDELDLQVEVFTRPYEKNSERLITVCLVNRKDAGSQIDQVLPFPIIFQSINTFVW